jgi:hypothetical protein
MLGMWAGRELQPERPPGRGAEDWQRMDSISDKADLSEYRLLSLVWRSKWVEHWGGARGLSVKEERAPSCPAHTPDLALCDLCTSPWLGQKQQPIPIVLPLEDSHLWLERLETRRSLRR